MKGFYENCEKHSQSAWEVLEEQWIEKVPNSKLYLSQLIIISKNCLEKLPDERSITELGVVSLGTHIHPRYFHLIHDLIMKRVYIKNSIIGPVY